MPVVELVRVGEAVLAVRAFDLPFVPGMFGVGEEVLGSDFVFKFCTSGDGWHSEKGVPFEPGGGYLNW